MTLGDYNELSVNFEHCVYKLSFPNGKVYFGETMHIKKRLYSHSSVAYRKNNRAYYFPIYRAIRYYTVYKINVEIIFTGTFSECEAYERMMIKEHGTVELGKTYNVLKSSPKGTDKFTTATKKKMSKSISDAWVNSKRKNIIRKNSGNPVWQYSLDGKFIQEWPSCSWAARSLKVAPASINRGINGARSAKGFMWLRAKGNRPKKIKPVWYLPRKDCKPVEVRDKNTHEILYVYKSRKIACLALNLNIKKIKLHINNPNKVASYKGYIFTDASGGYEKYLAKKGAHKNMVNKKLAKMNYIESKYSRNARPIWEYNKSGAFVQEWPSIGFAASRIGLSKNSSSLRNSLKDLKYTCKGRYWMYATGTRPKKYPLFKSTGSTSSASGNFILVKLENINTKQILEFKSLRELSIYLNLKPDTICSYISAYLIKHNVLKTSKIPYKNFIITRSK